MLLYFTIEIGLFHFILLLALVYFIDEIGLFHWTLVCALSLDVGVYYQ